MREKTEQEFSRAIARMLWQQRKRILQEVQSIFIDIDWDREQKIFQGMLIPHLQKIFIEGGELSNTEILTGKQGALPNVGDSIIEQAIDYAKNRGAELAIILNTTTKNIVDKALTTFFSAPGLKIKDFRSMVDAAFSPSRANKISVTEITKSYEDAAVTVRNIYKDMGYSVKEIWYTAADERVCAICRPRHGKERQPDWDCPAHVNCNCRVTSRIV